MSQTAEKAEPQNIIEKNMKEITALCKRRGFIYQASEIYGGINGFWDYGPLGTELKNNLRDWWWRKMVLCPPIGPDGTPVDIVGLDSAIIQNPKVWVASGHVGGFADPMVDCKETKLRYRADHLKFFSCANASFVVKVKEKTVLYVAFEGEANLDDVERKFKKLGIPKNIIDSNQFYDFSNVPNFNENRNLIVGPDASEPGSLTEPKAFNLLFETKIGAVASEDNIAYLRGETAQGIFVNYKNVLDSSRVKVPFGIAQVGKAFRNEVNPRNFIFRSREFEQMEMEFFCHPKDAKMWFDFWKEERQKFWQELGLTKGNLLMREHGHNELVFYSKGTFDIEYKFPFTDPGFGELEGIAYRGDYDLKQHQEHSKQKLEYIDQVTNERYLPHVIEPAAGLTRGVLAVLCEAFTPDPTRPSGVYLNFHPRLAPKKAAILPLTAKDGQPEVATKLYLELREEFPVDLDIKQNIGKRYARQDEIGTPFCLTIDNDTLKDETITVRHRNTMKQERISLSNAKEFIRKGLASAS